MQRIFIVGMARSGTTLIQSLVSAHPKVFTFPETHFFSKTISQKSYKKHIQWINKTKINRIKKFINNNNYRSSVKQELKPGPWRVNRLSKKLIAILDEISRYHGYNIWVEKTPNHLLYIDKIKKAAPSSFFIHVLRNGLDNVASLYEASRKYNNVFNNDTIDSCIFRYKKEFTISKQYKNNKNHYHLVYDDLVDEPTEQIKDLFRFLKIPLTDNVLQDFNKNTAQFILPSEEWKEKNKTKIVKSHKAFKVFTEKERAYIQKELNNYTINEFR